VLLSPHDIPDPEPYIQRDGALATPGMKLKIGARELVDARQRARKQGRKRAAAERQRKRIRGLAACQATLAVLRGERPK